MEFSWYEQPLLLAGSGSFFTSIGQTNLAVIQELANNCQQAEIADLIYAELATGLQQGWYLRFLASLSLETKREWQRLQARLQQAASKEDLSKLADYVWLNPNNDISYFNRVTVSGADGACGLASIYKVAGTNEVGAQARAKAVAQLNAHLDEPVVNDLIKSEIRGELLSSELASLTAYGFYITPGETAIIANLKTSRKKLIELGEQLKLKYFSDRDLPISAGNYSYAQLFIDGKLDSYCDVSLYEKLLLMELEKEVAEVNTEFEQLVASKVRPYIDQVIASSGFWLGVANKSAGVMGAVAYINRVNFRVLAINGDYHGDKPEVVEICRHISVDGDAVHSLYLHSELSDIAGVQRNSYHFDVLEELGCSGDLDLQASKVDLVKFFVNYLSKEAIKAENFSVDKEVTPTRGNYWDELLADLTRVKGSKVLQALALSGKINFRIWELSEQLDGSNKAVTADKGSKQESTRIKLVSEFRGKSTVESNLNTAGCSSTTTVGSSITAAIGSSATATEFIEILHRNNGYSLLTATPGVLNSKEIDATTVENREETKERGFSMSNVPLSDEKASSDGKFNLGSMFTYKDLRSTTTQMNNPSVIGDFSINTDSNHTGSDISSSGVAGINRDGSRLQGDTNTSHSGIFMAFAPNVFKDIARGKDMSDIRYNHEEAEEVDCRDKEQPNEQQLDEQPVELNETTKINGSKKSATKVKLKRPDEYSDDLTQGYSEYNLDDFISSVFTDPKALAEYEKYTAERGQYRFWENNDFSVGEVSTNRCRDASNIVSFIFPAAYGSENSDTPQQSSKSKYYFGQRHGETYLSLMQDEYDNSLAMVNALGDMVFNPRTQGLLQTAWGVAQVTASVSGGIVSAPTVVSPIIAAGYATIGLDNIYTGVKSVVSGKYHSTALFKAATGVGLSEQAAAWTEFAINLGPSVPAVTRKVATVIPAATKEVVDFSKQSITKLYDLHRAKRFNKYVDVVNFTSKDKLIEHFAKHNSKFGGVYSNISEYLEGARDVMRYGYKVEYRYNPRTMPHIDEIRVAYIKFMGNSSKLSVEEIIKTVASGDLTKSKMKFEFLATNPDGHIATYHIESAEKLFKKINSNKHIKVINPQPKVKP